MPARGVISPASCELDSSFTSLYPGVHRQQAVKAEVAGCESAVLSWLISFLSVLAFLQPLPSQCAKIYLMGAYENGMVWPSG